MGKSERRLLQGGAKGADDGNVHDGSQVEVTRHQRAGRVRDGVQVLEWFFLRAGGALAPFDNLLKMTDLFPAEMPHSYSFTYNVKSLNAGWLAGPATVKAGPAGERDTGQQESKASLKAGR